MRSITSQEESADKERVTFTAEESRWSLLKRMAACLRQNQDQEEHLRPRLWLRMIGSVIRWIAMAGSIGTMNVAGCSGDTRLMMPSLQHIVTTRIHLYILFNLPLSSICKVKSSGLLLNGICLSPICYANVPLSPLIRPSSQQLDISRYRWDYHLPSADCFIYAIKWYLMRGFSTRPWQSAKTQSWDRNNRWDSGKGRRCLVQVSSANQRLEQLLWANQKATRLATVLPLLQEMFNREKEHKLLQKRIKQGLKISWRTQKLSHIPLILNFEW